MTQIAIIVGNPKQDSFSHALAAAYRRGAETAGHAVEMIELSRMTFDPILHQGFDPPQPLEPDLQKAQQAIGTAGHLVFVWPLWLGWPPALMKGFLERVLTSPGFAVERLEKPPFYRPKLTGKTARSIMTMQMPSLMYRWLAGARAARTFEKNVLGFVGIKPVRRTVFGMIDHVSDATRLGWLEQVEALGARGA